MVKANSDGIFIENIKAEYIMLKICKNCCYFCPEGCKEGWGECEILSSCNYGKLTEETDTCPACSL